MFALGNCHSELGEAAFALAYFYLITELWPADGEAWYNLGNAGLDAKISAVAEIAYERALKFAPELGDVVRANQRMLKKLS